MATIVDKILGRAGKTAPTSAEIRQEVSHAEAAVETARRALVDAQAGYRATLLVEDAAATTTAKAAIIAAEVDIDRAEALVAALRERFLEECEREAEVDRIATYNAATTAQAAAVRRLAEYEPLARRIVEILADVAKAELEVAAANADLPAGLPPIESPELSVRGLPAQPREILEDRAEDAGWFYVDGPLRGTVVEDAFAGTVKPAAHGGRIGTLVRRFNTEGTREVVVVRRRRRIVRFLPATGRAIPDAVSAGVALPAFGYGQEPIWSPTGALAVMTGGNLAAGAPDVVARAERSRAMAGAQGRDDRFRHPDSSVRILEEPELLAEAERFAAARGAR